MSKKILSCIKNNFCQWYQDVIDVSELACHGNVKGCMIILPYGYALWENIQRGLDQKIKNFGAQNMAFPMLIPYYLLEKEKDHVAGFSPEMTVVTHAGGKRLEEDLVIRPTSEVVIHSFFKDRIKSWRDLPLKVNQWCSVVRWEMRPRLFLRTTEFWWQEGHTAHGSLDCAKKQVADAIYMYQKFCEDILAIPVIVAKKPEHEKFAGALETWTIEGMMKDGKALQMGTSHLLSQEFAKACNMSFQDKDMKLKTPHLTSWGVTTRLVGALIMVHGDQKGLVLPPKIAPYLFYIVPILKNDNVDDKNVVIEYSKKIKESILLCGYNVFLDDSEKTLGNKFFESESKGYPFRIEIGMRDIKASKIILYSRFEDKKENVNISLFFDEKNELKGYIESLVSKTTDLMREAAILYREKSTLKIKKIEEAKENKFYQTSWCGRDEKEFKKYKLSVRCILGKSSDTNCCIHENCTPSLKIITAKGY